MKIKKINELFFDNKPIAEDEVKFYLINPKTNKSFPFEVKNSDQKILEEIFKRNKINYEVDDGIGLPF